MKRTTKAPFFKWAIRLRLHFISLVYFINLLHFGNSDTVPTTVEEPLTSCPEMCNCERRNIIEVFEDFNQKHYQLKGADYRRNLNVSTENEVDYLDSFGVVSSALVSNIVQIFCEIRDKKRHTISQMLNGLHQKHYTSLEIKCSNFEEIVWDVPSWGTTLNILVNENCDLRPLNNSSPRIKIPVNIWVFESYGGGKAVIESLVLSHATNLIALVIADTSLETLPNFGTWKKSFQSVSTVSYHNNNLRDFNCEFVPSHYKLDTLNLAGNALDAFPACLLRPDTASVRYLSLSHNQISDLSALYMSEDPEITLANIKKHVKNYYKLEDRADVEIVDLSHNEIRSIDGVIAELPDLKILDLASNLITHVHQDAFLNLRRLEVLSLMNNRLTRLSGAVLAPCPMLKRVSLAHNRLEEYVLDAADANRSRLHLDLRHNRLVYAPAYPGDGARLNIRLQLAHNPLRCDCDGLAFQKLVDKVSDLMTRKRVFPDLTAMQCNYPSEHKGVKMSSVELRRRCLHERDCPPGCHCFRELDRRLVVNCSGRHLMEMPERMPAFSPRDQLVLWLDHNPIQLLGRRPYFARLTELHLHTCLLNTVTAEALESLTHLKVLKLHRNLLTRLPVEAQNLTLGALTELTLHSNPWACGCDNLWLKAWVERHRPVLERVDGVRCVSPDVAVLALREGDVACKPQGMLDYLMAALMSASTALSTLYVVYHYRSDIGQMLYLRLGLRLWSVFKYGDERCAYDAFVFYSQNNYKWVVDSLVKRLEGGSPRYKLCLHFRDFPKDEVVVENVPLAIRLSRCSLLLLTRDFLQQEWAIDKLRATFQRQLLGSDNLIVLVAEDITPDHVTPDLRRYMRSHDFLHIDEPQFWEKLEYFLPPPRFLGPEDQTSDDVSTRCIGDGDTKTEDVTHVTAPGLPHHHHGAAGLQMGDGGGGDHAGLSQHSQGLGHSFD